MWSPAEFGRSIFPRSPERQLQLEKDILDELQFHLDCRTKANLECGMSEEEARTLALNQFGDPESILDACIDAHDSEPVRRAARFAARVMPLGLACGFAAAVLVVLYALAVKPPATYPPGDRWIAVWWENLPTGFTTSDSSIDDFESWSSGSQTADYVALAAYRRVVSRFGTESESLMGKYVSGGYLREHGVRPAIGRTFTGEVSDQVEKPAVISYEFWERRFDRSPDVLGAILDVGGQTYTIVGVAQEGYQTYYPFDFFAPLEFDGRDRSTRRYLVSARLKSGVSLATVERELNELTPIDARDSEWRPRVRSPQDVYGEDYPRQLVPYGMLAVMLLVISIIGSRSRPASWSGLNLAATVAGVAVVGIVTALGATDLLRKTVLAGVDQRFNFSVDTPVVVGFLLIVILSVFARESLRRPARPRVEPGALDDSTERISPALVLTNALAFLMLVSAVTLTHDWWHRRSTDLGFNVNKVFVLPVLLPDSEFADRAQRRAFFNEAIERLDTSKVIEQYTFSSGFPTMSESQNVTILLPENRSGSDRWEAVSARPAGTDYFETIGITVLAGKPFHRNEDGERPKLAVINAAMAARYWPDGSAIGRRVRVYGTDGEFEITAVVDNTVSFVPGDESTPVFYPLIWHWTIPQSLIVRTSHDFRQVAAHVRTTIEDVNPAAHVGNLAMGGAALAATSDKRLMTVAFTWVAALLALALASSFTFRSVRSLADRRVRMVTLKRATRARGEASLRPVFGGVAVSLIVGGLLSTPLSHLLITEMSLNAQVGALLVVLPAVILVAMHLAAAFIPLRQLGRIS